MSTEDLRPEDYWRGIILYGQNSSTYKFALAQALAGFVVEDSTQIPFERLAAEFFKTYCTRAQSGKPQGSVPSRKTAMERIVEAFQSGQLSEDAAIARARKEAFGDVLSRFHNVNQAAVPSFYEMTSSGIVLTDLTFQALKGPEGEDLRSALYGRWDLVEDSFGMRVSTDVLSCDLDFIFRIEQARRTNITPTRPILNAYQNDYCFYCGQSLIGATIEVDHVIPRSWINHDELWNLVLADRDCNNAKGAQLPTDECIAQLARRNEWYIRSDRPVRKHLIMKTGLTPEQRLNFLLTRKNEARKKVFHEWPGPKGGFRFPEPLMPLVA